LCAIDLAGNGAGSAIKLFGNAAQAEVVVLQGLNLVSFALG
jgi:hypothetical protein